MLKGENMYREVTFKQYYLEIKNKKYIVLVMTIIISLLFFAMLYMDFQKQIKNQAYGAYGELYIENTDIEDESKVMLQNENSSIIPVVTSSDVYNSVLNDPTVSEYGLSLSEIEKMIYFRELYNNEILKMFVVSDDSEVAKPLCESLCNNVVAHLANKGYRVETKTNVEYMGTVNVEIQDNQNEQGEKIYLVNTVTEKENSISNTCELALISIIMGLGLSLLMMCIRFTFNKKISYYEQIKNDYVLLARSVEKNELLNLYSSGVMVNERQTAMNIISLSKSTKGKKFVDKYAEEISSIVGRVLIVNYVNSNEHGCNENNKDYVIVNGDYVLSFDAEFSFDNEEEYKHVVFYYDNINSIPLAKGTVRNTIKTALLVESNSIDIEQLNDFMKLASQRNLVIAGVIFLEK